MREILLANLSEGLFRRNQTAILTTRELQQVYLYLLKKGQMQAVVELEKSTNEKPSKQVSVTALEFLLNSGKVGAVKNIQQATGIKPEINNRKAENAYFRLNKVNVCHLIKPNIIKELHQITGKKATPKIIDSWFETLMKNEDISGIVVIEKMTGLESKYKTEVEFLLFLRRGEFREAKNFYESNKSKLAKKYGEIEGIFKRMMKTKIL